MISSISHINNGTLNLLSLIYYTRLRLQCSSSRQGIFHSFIVNYHHLLNLAYPLIALIFIHLFISSISSLLIASTLSLAHCLIIVSTLSLAHCLIIFHYFIIFGFFTFFLHIHIGWSSPFSFSSAAPAAFFY